MQLAAVRQAGPSPDCAVPLDQPHTLYACQVSSERDLRISESGNSSLFTLVSLKCDAFTPKLCIAGENSAVGVEISAVGLFENRGLWGLFENRGLWGLFENRGCGDCLRTGGCEVCLRTGAVGIV